MIENNIKKWMTLVETYSTLHAKDTEKFESPDLDASNDPIDNICLDVPLLIRLMEFAKEDAADDMQLHKVAERCIAMSKQVPTLKMSHYDQLTAALQQSGQDNTDNETQ